MRSVGIKELKNRLSEYLRHVETGEIVLVTERDHVVAELVPPNPGRAQSVHDAELAEAVRQGWLTPPLMPGGPLPPRKPVASLKKILAELSRDRGDR